MTSTREELTRNAEAAEYEQLRDSRPSDAELVYVLKDIRELLGKILKEVSHGNAT